MIRSESNFLERLKSIADNFNWQITGNQICAWRNGLYYDPLTAYVQIAKGDYVQRHNTDEIPVKACMHPHVFKHIMQALYRPDHADPLNSKLRRDIIDACGINPC